MSLNAAQIAKRAGKLTASRVACLMTGDAEKIMRLYREMIGDEIEEDLSHVWPVRLGEATEQLQLEWFQENNRTRVIRRGEVVQHPHIGWAVCTLDGWLPLLQCPLEVKHVGGREPLEIVIDRYQPQMQWQMEVTKSSQCALSVIMGANEPIVEFIDRDDEYIDEMIRRGKQFMDCVRKRVPPVALDAVPPPCDPTKIVDMTGRNEWGLYAGNWLDTRMAAKQNDDCSKLLKAMVPADAKRCHGHGITITRDRANRLSLREAIS